MKVRKKIGDLGKEQIRQLVQAFLDELDEGAVALLEYFEEVENPEFETIEVDEEGKILSFTAKDGSHYAYNLKSETIEALAERIEELDEEISTITGLDNFENVEDPEGRTELKKDPEDKIVSYRKKDGTLVETAGIESPILKTDNISLSDEGMDKLQQDLKDAGFNPSVLNIKDYNLPKFGTVDITTEVFYLTYNEEVSSKADVALIQLYDDTVENAAAKRTLSYFYVKNADLIPLPSGGYDRNSITPRSIRLDFYAAAEVTKIGNKYYVISTLEGGAVVPSSIEVIQITDTPPVNAWAINKKTEHYCIANIDFGSYLSGNSYVGVKFQGSSTLNFRKKNFRFTFYKGTPNPYYPIDDDKFGKKDKIKVGECVRTSGYNLKANWNDNSRIKEDIMTILLMAVWENRGSYGNYPWDDEITPFSGATGMIKGFPIEVSVGGNFYGLDVFGLKKDKANYLLDKDKDGMIQGGTRGNWADSTNWTAASPGDWEDELNDEEDWDVMYPSGNGQTASNDAALKEFFDYINGRLYKDSNDTIYLSNQITKVGDKYYVTSTIYPGQGSVTATRTSDPAYIGSDDNLYILSELTDISGTLYVTSTLVDGQPTSESVTATLVSGGHNIYAGSDGNRYLSSDLTSINNVYYVTSKIVWDTTGAIEVSNIPFNKKTMPERMSIPYWIDYIICMQVFLMRDNTCRNLMLYSAADKKKFYPFFYDLDLSWDFSSSDYNLDVMVPASPNEHSGSYAGDMSLWENFKDEWWDEIINRYNELRRSVLNVNYINAVYKDVTDNIPNESYTAENNRWSANTSKTNFETLIANMQLRLEWLDNEYYK